MINPLFEKTISTKSDISRSVHYLASKLLGLMGSPALVISLGKGELFSIDKICNLGQMDNLIMTTHFNLSGLNKNIKQKTTPNSDGLIN